LAGMPTAAGKLQAATMQPFLLNLNMKSILSVLLFCLFYCSSFGQSYRDLIGIWKYYGNNSSKSTLNFIDSNQVVYSIFIKGIPQLSESAKLTYSLDYNQYRPLIIRMRGVSNKGTAINLNWFIKIYDNDTLKVQGAFKHITPIEWEEPETPINTAMYTRKRNK
jgi:hypothetical protein